MLCVNLVELCAAYSTKIKDKFKKENGRKCVNF